MEIGNFQNPQDSCKYDNIFVLRFELNGDMICLSHEQSTNSQNL